MCGGTGSVVSQDTIVTDIESWISKFKYSTEYRAVDIYVNPYLRSFLCKGVFSVRWKWMLKYKLKITFIADETISLNEFKATLAGSDLEITDVVLQGQSLDDIIEAHHEQMEEAESDEQSTLDYYSKDDRNGNGSDSGSNNRSNLPPRPKRKSYG
jgi:ribonuclease G